MKNFYKKLLIISIIMFMIAISAIIIINTNTTKLPILCYHSVSDEIPEENSYLYVTKDVFEHQMNLLLENGYTPISYYDIIENKELPKKPIIITFDDGYYDNYFNAFPILQKLNIKATIFVITDILGHKTETDRTDKYTGMLSWEECMLMENSGLINIESHSKNHLLMGGLSKDEYSEQFTASKEKIDTELNKDSKIFAYPYGDGSKKMNRFALKNGYYVMNYVAPSRVNILTKHSLRKLRRIEPNNDTTDEEFLKAIKFHF